MRTILTITAAAALLAVGAQSAQAHTQAFGFIPQANGDVQFFIGTYAHSGTTPVEGSLTIDGTPYAFTTAHDSTSTTALGLTGMTAPGTFYTEVTAFGANVDFQSVTVSGLSDGTYSFNYTGTTGSHWNGPDLSFPISAFVDVQNPVPEPTSAVLMGIGVVGLIAVRRRRRKTLKQSDVET